MSIPKKLLITSAVVAVVGLGAGFVFLADTNTQRTTPPPATSDLTVPNLLKQVNEQRAKAGVAPLKEDPLLDKSAQLKADEIKQTGVFEHIGSTGKHGLTYINDVGANCRVISENLVEDYPNVRASINGWLGSPAHKAAMLDPRYDTTGFGVADVGGHNIAVEHFCDLP